MLKQTQKSSLVSFVHRGTSKTKRKLNGRLSLYTRILGRPLGGMGAIAL